MKILVVEDNEDSRIMLRTLLKGQDYIVIEALNGKQALELALEYIPDIIISDILMPEMDGFEFCRQVKSTPKISHIPFIFYTATYTERADEELALSLGASWFFVKPMEPDVFTEKLSEIVKECQEGNLLGSANTLEAENSLKDKHIQVLTNKIFNRDVRAKNEIEEHKHTKERLRFAQEQAEKGNLAEKDFLSKVSHELRTPLNAILGFAQLLVMDQENKLTPAQDEQVKAILKAGDYLLELIIDLLDLSRIDALKHEYKLETMKINQSLNEILSFLEPRSREKGVQIKNQISDEDELFIKASPALIKQVFLNLLTNAIKYNQPNGVVTIFSQKIANNRVSFLVKDTGKGIAEDRLEKIFELFSRLDTELGGRGVGLSITKRLVELMGGSIEVESTLGEGSCFKVIFSLAN